MPDPLLVISCEHAVNHVPLRFRHLFADDAAVLKSHRGFDLGALELAESLAGALNVPCFASRVTRLLVDHNRSPHHPALWSAYSRTLSKEEKAWLLETYYEPFRDGVRAWLVTQLQAGATVLHLAVHSFTPVLDGRQRMMDVGILYDPQRPDEEAFGRRWQRELQLAGPAFRVRMNAPYRGRSDCHQTTYRRLYDPDRYLAIELEVNQALLDRGTAARHNLASMLATTLRKSLEIK